MTIFNRTSRVLLLLLLSPLLAHAEAIDFEASEETFPVIGDVLDGLPPLPPLAPGAPSPGLHEVP